MNPLLDAIGLQIAIVLIKRYWQRLVEMGVIAQLQQKAEAVKSEEESYAVAKDLHDLVGK